MDRIRSVIAYSWAVLCTLIVLVTFLMNPVLSEKLASTTGVTVSPWFSGGAVASVVDHRTYHTKIHRPVFDGLFGERKEGFVQVDWGPRAGLPQVVEERISINHGRRVDFLIRIDTRAGTATITPYDASVLSVGRVSSLGADGWAVRVVLENWKGPKPAQ